MLFSVSMMVFCSRQCALLLPDSWRFDTFTGVKYREKKQETHCFYIQIHISSQSKFKLQLLWKFVGTVIWMQAWSFFISTYFLSFAIKRILLFVHVVTRWDSFGENFMLNSHLFHSNNCQSENFKHLRITMIIKLAKKKLFQQFEMCAVEIHSHHQSGC